MHREGLAPRLAASLRMSKNSWGGPGGAEGGVPVPAVRETMLGAGARAPAASKGVPVAGSRATREASSAATRQMVLAKQGTYKLLTFLFPSAS